MPSSARRIEPDGARVRDLGRINLSFNFAAPPAWSPDSRQIAWTEGVNCGQVVCDEEQIWIVDVNTGERRRLARSAIDPEWSPDGRFIAYTHAHLYEDTTGGTAEPAFRMRVIVSDSQGRRGQTVARGAERPTWSPDGTQLAYFGDTPPTYGGVLVANADGTRKRPLRGIFADNDLSARWSPKGDWITNGAIAVRPNGAARRRLAQDPIGGFAWSPDGSQVAWSSGSRIVIAVVEDGSRRSIQPRLLKGTRIMSVAWPPGGRLFLVAAASDAPICGRNMCVGPG